MARVEAQNAKSQLAGDLDLGALYSGRVSLPSTLLSYPPLLFCRAHTCVSLAH
jgi:hypothetical protein